MIEKEIELEFIKFLNSREHYQVLGRQVQLPFGVLDVLAWADYGGGPHATIAEIKAGTIDERACTQLIGYMAQVDWMTELDIEPATPDHPDYKCTGILVGSRINAMAMRVVKAFRISFCRYSIENESIAFDWHVGFEHLWGYGEELARHIPGVEMNEVINRIRQNAKQRKIDEALFGWQPYTFAHYDVAKRPFEKWEETEVYWRRGERCNGK